MCASASLRTPFRPEIAPSIRTSAQRARVPAGRSSLGACSQARRRAARAGTHRVVRAVIFARRFPPPNWDASSAHLPPPAVAQTTQTHAASSRFTRRICVLWLCAARRAVPYRTRRPCSYVHPYTRLTLRVHRGIRLAQRPKCTAAAEPIATWDYDRLRRHLDEIQARVYRNCADGLKQGSRFEWER